MHCSVNSISICCSSSEHYKLLAAIAELLRFCIKDCYKYGAFDVLVLIYFKIQSLEAEILRLNHLRDRASEKGHKKEYPLSKQYALIVLNMPKSDLMPQLKKLRHHLIFINFSFCVFINWRTLTLSMMTSLTILRSENV